MKTWNLSEIEVQYFGTSIMSPVTVSSLCESQWKLQAIDYENSFLYAETIDRVISCISTLPFSIIPM